MIVSSRRRPIALLALTAALAVLLAVVSIGPGVTHHVAAQSGTVIVTALACPPTVDAASDDQTAFADCVEPVNNLAFALTAGGITRPRTTAAGQTVSWSAVSGPYSLLVEDPPGASVVFCGLEDAAEADWDRLPVDDNAVSGELEGAAGLRCLWYLLPVTATATATAAATATATATRAPTATAAIIPTATMAPTATQIPTSAPTVEPPDAITTSDELEMFRGDPGHSGAQPGPGPTGDPQLLWRYPLGINPFSSPAVVDGTAYVGGVDGVYALDTTTGTVRWRFAASGPFISSPAVLSGVVYIGSASGAFYAIDGVTGEERWSFETGGKIASSAAVAGGSVYFTSEDGNAYALDAASGAERWRFPTDADLLFSSPAVVDDVVYFGVGDINGGAVYALDATTGEPEWSSVVVAPVVSSPAVVDDVVYFGDYDGSLYAVEVATGERLWRFRTRASIWSSPAVSDGLVYVGSRDHDVYAVDVETGEERWTFDAADWVDGSPSVVDGVVYIASKDRTLYAIDAATGEERWQISTGGPAGAVSSSAVVVDGVVYATSRDGFIYAIGGEAPLEARGDLPADVPRELVTADGRYLFDRLLFADAGAMSPTGAAEPIRFYAQDEQTPLPPLYAVVPGRADGELARYLPERIEAPDDPCPAEALPARPLQSGDTIFAFAGFEPILTTGAMPEVGTASDDRTIHAETDALPIFELFIPSDGGLERYVLLDERHVPATLNGRFPFAGQSFAFIEDVTESVDVASLTRAGCAGPFPLFTEPNQAGPPFLRLYAAVGGPNGWLLAFEPEES